MIVPVTDSTHTKTDGELTDLMNKQLFTSGLSSQHKTQPVSLQLNILSYSTD